VEEKRPRLVVVENIVVVLPNAAAELRNYSQNSGESQVWAVQVAGKKQDFSDLFLNFSILDIYFCPFSKK
jgi:hypothetical protein